MAGLAANFRQAAQASLPGHPRLMSWQRRGCPAAQASLRSLRMLGCVPGMTKVTVALEPIDQHRVVVKELVLVGERKIGDRRAEAVINRLERADDAVDRKVAREHAALGAENLDGVADD